jgi:hypothetical protein
MTPSFACSRCHILRENCKKSESHSEIIFVRESLLNAPGKHQDITPIYPNYIEQNFHYIEQNFLWRVVFVIDQKRKISLQFLHRRYTITLCSTSACDGRSECPLKEVESPSISLPQSAEPACWPPGLKCGGDLHNVSGNGIGGSNGDIAERGANLRRPEQHKKRKHL